MAHFSYVITNEHNGSSVKTYLRQHLEISSRVLVDLKKPYKGITINGNHARSVDILKTNDVLELNYYEDAPDYQSSDIGIKVVYEDENFLVVDKPYGMPMYKAGKAPENLLFAVTGYYKNKGEKIVYRPIYRLDKDTSGLVVVAKNNIVASSCKLSKVYYAVCEGKVSSNGRIDAPIDLEDGSFIKRTTGKGLPAVTNYYVINSGEKHSFLKFVLETGRTHQIRVHMASIGHPLAGDDLYGGSLSYIERQALYCGEVHISCKLANLDIVLNLNIPSDIKKSFKDVFI